jgi:hypothetical protein
MKMFFCSYLQIQDEKSGIWADRMASGIVSKCDRGMSEVFGLLKIPFVLMVLTLAHLILYVPIILKVQKPFAD